MPTLTTEPESLRQLFESAIDPVTVQTVIAGDLQRLGDSYLDAFFLQYNAFARKEIQEHSYRLVQSILDNWLKIMQWSDHSKAATNLLAAYTGMVFGMSLSEAAEKFNADFEDLDWLTKLRPPEKADKGKFKPTPPRKKQG